VYLISYISIVAALLAISVLVPLAGSWPQSKRLGTFTSGIARRRLIHDLPAALQSGEIYLVYQPKLRLRTGTIEGVEALLRWQHRTLGAISRKSLIPLAEERGRIRELTIWVLRQSLKDQARLAASGHEVGVHVNVSASLLSDADFVRDVCALVGPGAGPIGLEITETALIENSPVALANLHRMIRHGVAISIDDYGSGLSSLAYLKELPAAELKIDKMFVSGMTLSHRDPLIVRSTIDLAHALGLSVVAEGVESMAALALLKVMGCDFAQGFLISPPLPIDELTAFLQGDAHQALLSAASASLSPPTEFWTRVSHDAGHLAPASRAG
jgi:EAL domain-containing protein (putative c-di-GMP-specific phosphodiesterase class I)